MEDFRTYKTTPPFQYNGQLVYGLLYYKGNSDLVHSWDLVIRGENLSKMIPEDRRALGFSDHDMVLLNARVQSYVDYLENRR